MMFEDLPKTSLRIEETPFLSLLTMIFMFEFLRDFSDWWKVPAAHIIGNGFGTTSRKWVLTPFIFSNSSMVIGRPNDSNISPNILRPFSNEFLLKLSFNLGLYQIGMGSTATV